VQNFQLHFAVLAGLKLCSTAPQNLPLHNFSALAGLKFSSIGPQESATVPLSARREHRVPRRFGEVLQKICPGGAHPAQLRSKGGA
jgi:hypothetical protein